MVKYLVSELSEEFYKNIYSSVFDEWTYDGNCPAEVYISYEDEKIVGFLSGYPQSQVTWYLQRAGAIKNEQYKFKDYSRGKFALDYIQKTWPYIMTLVRNDDISTLKLSLSLGFKIIGTRIDTANRLWIEMMRKKEV